jgi:hypothetical protein
MLYRNINTTKEKIMSQLMTKLLERLAEMFPGQDYQTRLDQFISSKYPQSVGDVEYWQRQYDSRNYNWERGV